jgi:hypothetical protein
MNLAALGKSLGVEIEPQLLELALTHRSFSYENGRGPNNERLEFLGDAILGFLVTAHINFTATYARNTAAMASKIHTTIMMILLARPLNILGAKSAASLTASVNTLQIVATSYPYEYFRSLVHPSGERAPHL